MSTTVTYKGSTLTTVNNQTIVLETAGTWLEDDISLTDVTQGGITPTGTKQINISQNGTVTEDVTNYASAQITVNVSGGGTPSATAHTIYFEFSDETDTTITAYYDNSFISDAITATTPTTYGQKTVTLAQLDGVTWYSYDPTESWETLYENNNTQYDADQTESYPYCWIPSLSNVYPTAGSVWRITYNGTEYRCTAVVISNVPIVGNPKFAGGTDDGSGVPFAFANLGWGAWSGRADLPNVEQNIPVKIERLVT